MIHQKKRVTFVGYSWNNQGIFLHSIFPEHYFGIFVRISLGIFSEYAGSISRECSTEGYALFINIDHKHGFVKRAANFPIEVTLCIDPYKINHVYQKMEWQGNIAHL